MTWCLIISPKANGARGPGSFLCSLSWRRQYCPADRKCTEELRLGGSASQGEGGRGVGERVHVVKNKAKQEEQKTLFAKGTKRMRKRLPKSVDQWTEESFLLDKQSGLHIFIFVFGLTANNTYWRPLSGGLVCSAMLFVRSCWTFLSFSVKNIWKKW